MGFCLYRNLVMLCKMLCEYQIWLLYSLFLPMSLTKKYGMSDEMVLVTGRYLFLTNYLLSIKRNLLQL